MLLLALGLMLSLIAWWGYGYAALLLITLGSSAVMMLLSGQRAFVQTINRLRPLWLPTAAYGAALLLSASFSVEPIKSIVVVLWSMAIVLTVIVCASYLQSEHRATIIKAMMIVSLLLFIINMLTWLINGARWPFRARWETNNGIALYNILGLVGIALGIFHRRLSWLWLAAYLWLVIFSESRGGLLGLAAGIVVLLIMQHRYALWLSALIGIGVITVSSERLFNLSHRPELWGVAWRMFTKSPIVGQGPNTYQQFYTAQYRSLGYLYAHAHSLPLNLLAESGIIGLLAFMWLAGAISWQLWQRRQDRFSLGILAAFASLMAHSLIDVLTTSPFVAGTMAILLGLSFVQGGESRGSQKESSATQDKEAHYAS